jgi:hypothetical protein
MPDPFPPPDPSREKQRARQRASVYLAIALLLGGALALLVLPLEKIPRAARLFTAAGDIVVAAVLWLVVRQKFDGK